MEKEGVAWAFGIAAYLTLVVLAAVWVLLGIFPEIESAPVQVLTADGTPQAPAQVKSLDSLKFKPVRFLFWEIAKADPPRGLALLAFLAGVIGSFIHAVGSLTAYAGNKQLKLSWLLWYVMRPPVGGALGLVVYFVMRAGFLSAGETMSPYGVVAFAALAGLFADRATEKLAEVFETLFRTTKERRQDRLAANAPEIEQVKPNPVPAATTPPTDVQFEIRGKKFDRRAQVRLGDVTLATTFVSPKELKATLPHGERPRAGDARSLVVVSGDGDESEPVNVSFT